MRLATRLSVFFLVALALVLAGFSATLHLIARRYLLQQLDEQLQSALNTLEASVDIEPGGLEWEPRDRQLSLGLDNAPGAVRWVVRDQRGGLVDRSANARAHRFPGGWAPASWPAEPSDGTVFGTFPGWRLAARRLELASLLRQGRGHPNDEPGYEVPYPVLVLVVGLAPAPAQATLDRLGLTLALLSAGVWVAAAAANGWLSRRILAPMHAMARAAAAMTPDDLDKRLPTPGSGDELDELGRAFNGLLDRLATAYERQRRFAGEASHQLRTPLAALLGQVQVARRRERSPEEYRRVLDIVQTEGTRLRQIVETLLFLAQPADASLPLQRVDLVSWVPDHLGRWADHPRMPDLSFETDGPSRPVRVHPTLLGQLLDNLLENAFKYSDPTTPVRVRVEREAESIVLSVEDHGRGLLAEDVARVFEPFFRSEEARRDCQDGVGLGLAVARRIAESFGGVLELRSTPGQGSRFRLRLPAADECESAAEADRRRPGLGVGAFD